VNSAANAEDVVPPPSIHRLDGKRALVTGAGRGIGRACALALAEAGAEVIVLARNSAELDSLAALIAKRGGKARAHPCDVTDDAALAAAFAGLDRLDILVNNAGGNRREHFLDLSMETFDWVLDLNLRATVAAGLHAARLMKQRGGVIVNLSSQFGHVGGPNRVAYCAAKHAIEGFTKAAALDLAAHNIRVVAVAPTGIETPGVAAGLADPQARAQFIQAVPLGRIGSVWEVAHAVVFLASPAASLITGTSLLVDGGWTAR
jgi:NAD(P)-dependent dehydrogenase (short-subunit alcohol dehydrogenase family)